MQINRVTKKLDKRYPSKNKTEKTYQRCRNFHGHNRNGCPAINVHCRQC